MIKIVDAPAELAEASLVGHKFARQQRLRDAGVSVPPFFCVVFENQWTAIADVVATYPGVGAGVERLTAWAETARSAAERVPLTPGGVQTAILGIIQGSRLARRRSSRMRSRAGRPPGRRRCRHLFAGLTDSHLYVSASALIDSISACAASVFSGRSVLYRAQRESTRASSVCAWAFSR